MNIEIQDIRDAEANGQESPCRKQAEEAIKNGESVKVSKYGEPLGLATTIAELEQLIGKL